jgi:hypothetical protein
MEAKLPKIRYRKNKLSGKLRKLKNTSINERRRLGLTSEMDEKERKACYVSEHKLMPPLFRKRKENLIVS